MKYLEENKIYLRAQKKVEKIRRFYLHVIIYLVINISLSVLKVLRNINNGETFEIAFFDFGTFALWWIWGIGLSIHAFAVFGFDKLFGRDWEERKIEEFMDEEKFNKE